MTASAAQLLSDCYALVCRVTSEAADEQLLRPSGCAGWNGADLLVHLLADARRALVTMATPVGGPADTDSVGYWRTSPMSDPGPGEGLDPHAQHVRRLAVAYACPAGIAREWCDTAPAAARAVAAGDGASCVTTQGHVLRVDDFASTLVVEAVLHLLDLGVALPGCDPPAAAVRHAADRIARVAGLTSPPEGDAVELLLKVTGRRPLGAADAARFGTATERLPLRL